MPVAVLSLDALTERDLGAWRALAAAAAEPNPFFEPEFVVPAARHLGGDGVGLAVAEAGGEWIGAMPVRRARWKGLPVPAYGAWMHDYCFFGAPLVAAGREEAALGLLLGWLRRRTALVPLEQLPVKGPVAEALTSVLAAAGVKPIVWNTWERAALHRRPENDYIESMLNSKRRRELRRQRKLLGEEHGGEVTGGDMVGDPAILDAFLKLEASGWKGRGGTAMTSAGHDAFLKEACTAFAAAGRLQVMAVRSGNTPVAVQCNLIAGSGVFCFKLGIDESYGRYSPGVLLQLDNVDVFHATPGLEWEDSCADPKNQMINRLWPDRREITTLLVPGGGLRGVAGRAQAGAAVSLRKRRKETP